MGNRFTFVLLVAAVVGMFATVPFLRSHPTHRGVRYE